jgi:hypothetical protein
MARSDFTGPLLAFGRAASGADNNPDWPAPSFFLSGAALLDQRAAVGYNPGQPHGTPVYGWMGTGLIFDVNYVPSTLSTTNLANAVTPTTAVALVLTAGTGFTASAKVINRSNNQVATGLFLIDGLTGVGATSTIAGNVFNCVSLSSGNFTIGSVLSGTGVTANTTIVGYGTGNGGTGTYIVDTPQTVTSTTITGVAGINGVPRIPFGQTGSGGPGGLGAYNPMCMIGRNVRITTASGDTAVYTVLGYDIYGYPMSEAITANGASTVSGKKAFKYIASVTPVGTVGATASVGTGDVYGFPLISDTFQDVQISWSATAITASTGYLAGVKTNPATTTTGDVRGTYAVQSASDGTKRLTINQLPPPTEITSAAGLFGITQV